MRTYVRREQLTIEPPPTRLPCFHPSGLFCQPAVEISERFSYVMAPCAFVRTYVSYVRRTYAWREQRTLESPPAKTLLPCHWHFIPTRHRNPFTPLLSRGNPALLCGTYNTYVRTVVRTANDRPPTRLLTMLPTHWIFLPTNRQNSLTPLFTLGNPVVLSGRMYVLREQRTI